MGVHNLPSITKQLITYGRPASTPAALVRWGTKADQETLVATVGDIAEKRQPATSRHQLSSSSATSSPCVRPCNGSIPSPSSA